MLYFLLEATELTFNVDFDQMLLFVLGMKIRGSTGIVKLES